MARTLDRLGDSQHAAGDAAAASACWHAALDLYAELQQAYSLVLRTARTGKVLLRARERGVDPSCQDMILIKPGHPPDRQYSSLSDEQLTGLFERYVDTRFPR